MHIRKQQQPREKKDAKLTSQFADHRISYHAEETAKLKLEIIRDN